MMDVIAILIALMMCVVMVLCAAKTVAYYDKDYDKGMRDGIRMMDKLQEMSPEDEKLLKELKAAVKLYIRQTGLYRSGDVKNLESACDFRAFKDEVWKVTVQRREQK